MSKLPTQLKWKLFARGLAALGYKQLRSTGGSARHFQRGDEHPVTFHEPHGNDTLKQGTLTEYLRKLGITREDLEYAIYGKRAKDEVSVEDRFRRTSLSDGTIISNCMACCSVVAEHSLEIEVTAAEDAHDCPVQT